MAINLKIIAEIIVIGVIVFALYTLIVPNSMNKHNLPENIYNNPKLREAYTFALENPDILEKFPCYCGCKNIGHENNKMCYINEDGSLSDHASLCSGCVGVTLDIKRMVGEGRDDAYMGRYIDEKYAPKDVGGN